MQLKLLTFRRVAHFTTFFLVITALLGWAATAASIHLTGASLTAAWGALGLAAVATFAALFWSRRAGWLVILTTAGITAGLFQQIKPTEDRNWAFDVAHGVTARVDGDIVKLGNVRNFDWQSIDIANVSWEERSYDLSKLASVDMVTSVWDSPDIAHLIVTFGFGDGLRVAFSVETRRESHEEFSSIGGFFRQFEMVLIAATEEDILQLRTNHRQEDVRLYPLDLNAEHRRALFLSYVKMAKMLEESPAFYHTLTRNCTTAILPLARGIKPEMKMDWRVLMSGHLPSYIDQLGGFGDEVAMEVREERAAITPLALSAPEAPYSDVIRAAYRSQ
ncbi:DUF4105 domain-containing protein [uncultured Sulfitobacter sp.]|uniref:Lnb N-terminal periplasmic domain-containing protein n=1 Tax=uncultured Sulfitobacter sp. TaxID=191468 RepID=UPI002620BA67|nr:DUF4105 domain-containing protein [uncultured Sulfitobacter sp.]